MRVQRVVMPNGAESWTVLGPDGDPVPAVEAFLSHLQALNRSPTTIRTYASNLKLWLEFLARVEVGVDAARVEHTAGVSRSWPYRQPQLREQIEQLRQQRSSRGPAVPPAERASADSLLRWSLTA
jgi:integrase/recombinase XerD